MDFSAHVLMKTCFFQWNVLTISLWDVCSTESDSLVSEDVFSLLDRFIDEENRAKNWYRKGTNGQRVSVKFILKIEKQAFQTYDFLKTAFEDKCLSWSNVFILFNWFWNSCKAVNNYDLQTFNLKKSC